jgi:hypothetical protein
LVSLEQTAIALAICALAFGAFCLIEPRTLDGYSVKPSRWIRQGVFALIVSGLVAGVQELR